MRQPQLDSRDDLLGQAANEYFEAVERGQSPSLSEFADRYPEVAEDIRRVFPALALVGDAADTNSSLTTFFEASYRQQVGDFLILRELGRGGMGIVYEAEQLSLGRRVALKVLPFAAVLDEKAIVRFKNEARAAATLDHPNIVPIHAVGNERGVYYYAMSLIEGRTLADLIRSLKSRLQWTEAAGDSDESVVAAPSRIKGDLRSETAGAQDGETRTGAACESEDFVSTWPKFHSREYCRFVARLGVQAARALQHAHERGVVHRDIKPGNLIVDASGKLWVTDFGLARVSTDAGLTMTGDLLGTMRYMAPEQLLGQHVSVDHRADVYSLGVTLYELLALRPAVDGDARQVIVKQITVEEPTPLRKLNSSLPVDIQTIVAKATAKQSSERYPSAKDFADDLERLLNREPIAARPPSLLDRTAKVMQRHSALVLTAGISLLALSTVLAVGVALLKEREFEATAANEKTSRLLYEAEMALAFHAYDQGWPEEAARILARVHQSKGGAEQEGLEWNLLNATIRQPASISLLGHQGSVNELAVFPDGKRLASVGDDGSLRIWDLKRRRQLQKIAVTDAPLYSVAISPDGRRVAVGSTTLFMYEEGGAPEAIFQCEHNIESIAFGANGTRLAIGARYHDVFLLTLEGNLIARTPNNSRMVSLEFMPESDQLLLPNRTPISDDENLGFVQLWRGDLSEVQQEFINPGNRQTNLHVARRLPGSDVIVAGERYNRRAHLIDVESSQRIASIRDPQSRSKAVMTDLGVSPGCTAIAAVYDDGTLDLYGLQSDQGALSFGKPLRTCLAHRGETLAVRFLSERQVATCGTDGAIRIWACSGDYAYDLGDSQVVDVRLSPDGELLLITTRTNCLVAESASGRILYESPDVVPVHTTAAWSTSGDRAAICLTTSRVRVLDRKGAQICEFDHADGPMAAAFSPSGELISVIGQQTIQICDSNTGEQIAQGPLSALGYAMAFSNDGKFLAYDDGEGRICISEVPRLHPSRALPYVGEKLRSAAFSPDDKILATGHNDGIVRLWDLASGSIRAEFLGHDTGVVDVTFGHDGRTLLTSDGVVRLWSVDHLRSYGSFMESAYRMSLSRDGRRLAVGNRSANSTSSAVLLWNLNAQE